MSLYRVVYLLRTIFTWFSRPPGDLTEPLARWREAFLEYVGAKDEWLTTFERLTRAAKPSAQAVVARRFELQRLYDRRSLKRLDYLALHRPTRLDVSQGLPALGTSIESSWSEADSVSLSAVDPEYHQIEKTIADLSAESHDSIREALVQAEASPEYRDALQSLQQRMRAINARIERTVA